MFRFVILLSWCCTNLLCAEESHESAWLDKVEKQKESISKLVSVLGSEAFTSEPELFEGLPHQNWNKNLLESEHKKGISFTKHGFSFYKKSRTLSDADSKALRLLLHSKAGYTRYSGPKFCGDYHPDFMVRFKSGEELVEIQVCFGCSEARIFKGDLVIYCDLNKKQRIVLNALLEDYYLERPDKKPEVIVLIQHAKRKVVLSLVMPQKGELKNWEYSSHYVISDGLIELSYMSASEGIKIRCDWNRKLAQWVIVSKVSFDQSSYDNLPERQKLSIAVDLKDE